MGRATGIGLGAEKRSCVRAWYENIRRNAEHVFNSRGCGRGMVLISYPHTNAERMSMSDGAASLLAAGVHAADEGAGCLKRQEVLDEGGEMRDSTKLGGMASTGLPDHGRV